MNNGISVKITYFTEQKGELDLYDFEGILEFKQELEKNYISVIYSRPGELGGIGELIIDLVANIGLADLAKFIAEGIAFDLLKSGSNSFILKPLLAAYRKLRNKNQQFSIDISELNISFQDSFVKIYKISQDSIFSELESIFKAIAIHYKNLFLENGEKPFEIHIPIFEDSSSDRITRFRVLLDVDEVIENVSFKNYFEFWGVQFDFSKTSRVYDLNEEKLLNNPFLMTEEYWAEWRRKENE